MLQRPLWTEGTLLCPQHLQQQDLYHERLLATRLAAAVPHAWGVLAVRFDPAALAAGQLALTHLRAVLPDGTPVELDDHSAHRPAARAIAPQFPATRERLTVHLGTPDLRPGAANVAPESVDTHAIRWRTITRPVFDLTLAHSARDLELLEPCPVLRFADEPRDELTSLPLAELVRDPAGGFTLDPTFIPPIAALSASPWLHAQLQQLLAVATSRWRALDLDRRRHHDLPRALLFHALSGALPRLRHLVDLPAAPPLLAHQHLLALAGELRGLASVDPSTLPPFVFTDLRASFGPLLAELQRRVADLLPDHHITVPLEPRPDGLWLGELHDDRLRGATFILAVESDADPLVLARELPTLTRIAAWKRISLIVRNNVLGAAIRPLARPPVELPALPRHAYFSVVPDDPSWLEVLRERNVALYLPPPYDPDHARVALHAIPTRDP